MIRSVIAFAAATEYCDIASSTAQSAAAKESIARRLDSRNKTAAGERTKRTLRSITRFIVACEPREVLVLEPRQVALVHRVPLLTRPILVRHCGGGAPRGFFFHPFLAKGCQCVEIAAGDERIVQ